MPSKTPITPAVKCPPHRYRLSFETERRLARTLAFLSATDCDPDRVPALCIREVSDGKGLIILVAVNAVECVRSKSLERIKDGFGRIFTALAEIESSKDVESEIFNIVLSMCESRIYNRLHFTRTRWKERKPIKKTLKLAIDALSQKEPTFATQAKVVISRINAWELYQQPPRLRNIVESIHHLSQLDGYSGMIQSIPNTAMDPSERDSLVNAIRKIARYREAARYLYRTAKKDILLRRMRCVTVILPPTAFKKTQMPKVDLDNISLESTLRRISLPKTQRNCFPRMCKLLRVSEQEANKQFTDQVKKTLSKAKVHAEIQLLFFCESDPKGPLPRVICSSKDACFLCNAFIACHGAFHMPRSHGKLYPGWRLPNQAHASTSEKQFNEVLEGQIKVSIGLLLQRQEKTGYKDPNESTVSTLMWSNSTVAGLVDDREKTNVHPQENAVTSPLDLKAEHPSVVELEDETKTQLISNNGTSPTNGSEASGLKELNPDLETVVSATKPIRLKPGETVTATVKPDALSVLHEAWPLQIFIEYTTGPMSSLKDLTCNLEWVPKEDVNNVQQSNKVKIIDPSTLDGPLSIAPNDWANLYLSAGKTLVRVNLG